MGPRLEPEVANVFDRYMERQCIKAGVPYRSFRLGGQDRDAGADFLITDATGFALVEFKHSQAQLRDEGKKERRQRLCELLCSNPQMRAIHNQCHFIAWRDSATGKVHCAPYRSEICNHRIFPNSPLLKTEAADTDARVTAVEYCEQFLNPSPERYAQKEEFERYLAWLMKEASASDRSTLSLMTYDDEGCQTIEFDSIDAAYTWLRARPDAQPGPRCGPRP